MSNTITPTPHQMRAIEAALSDMDKTGVGGIDGPGGTGKSACEGYVVKELWPDEEVLILGPTWQSVKVGVQFTGCPGKSIHSAIYSRSYMDENGELRFADPTADKLPRGGKILLQECYMVGSKIGKPLMAMIEEAGCQVLRTGDPYQLGPVKDSPHFTPETTSFELSEIHRQAQGIGTDTLTGVRLGKLKSYWDIHNYLHNHSDQSAGSTTPMRAIGEFGDRKLQYFLDAFARGQDAYIVVHKNTTRQAINNEARWFYGFAEHGPLLPGEKVISLSNTGMFTNGDQLVVADITAIRPEDGFGELLRFAPNDVGLRRIHFSDGRMAFGSPQSMEDGWNSVMGGLTRAVNKVRGSRGRALKQKMREISILDYAYAITAHKAQGSQADNVMYVLEPTAKEQAHKYVGMSRYKKQCFVTFTR